MKLISGLQNKAILVTGASGFLGAHLCDRLNKLGCNVLAIDSQQPQVKYGEQNSITFLKCDITKGDQVQKIFEKDNFNIIFHLAAIASPRACKSDFNLAYNVNVTGTQNLLRYSGITPKIVFMSSASVYGDPITLPISENHILGGSDPYSITKIMGEYLCKNYITNFGYNISIARNFNAFGIGQTTEYIVPTLITQALKNKKIEIWNSDPVRDLMYVDGTIEALITIATEGGNTVYNIGSGMGTRIGELAQTIRDSIDPSIEIVDLHKPVVGSRNLVSDNSRLRELGWIQQVELNSGLLKTINWFRSL